MRANFLLTTVLLTVISFSISANIVTPANARKAAVNAMYEKVNMYNNGIDYSQVRIMDTYTMEVDGQAVYYAFNMETGFIIISGEDAYTPVIGYAYEGSWNIEGAPEHYRSFIQGYVDQVLFYP